MNSIGNAIPESTVRSLLLPKFLCLEAQDYLRRPDQYSPGLATSLFQDAVEAFLRFLALDGRIEISEKAGFVELLNKVGKKHKRILDHRAAMTNLNKARVNFKHAGQMVLRDDAVGFQSSVNAFLNDISEDVLQLDFAAISLVDAIGHERTEELLRDAEKAIVDEKFESAIQLCAEAAARYLKYRAGMPGGGESFLGLISIGSSVLQQPGFQNAVDSPSTEALGHWVAIMIQRAQALFLLLARGVDVASFARFQEIAPPVSLTMAGRPLVIWFPHKLSHVSKENAEFCVRFVTETALQLRKTAIDQTVEEARAAPNAQDRGAVRADI